MAEEAESKTSQGLEIRIFMGADLGRLEARIQEAIARRAYDHFEKRGRQHGSNLGDWFSAEDEIQRPSNLRVDETGREIRVTVPAAGFAAAKIEVGVSENRAVVWALRLDSRNATADRAQAAAAEFGALLVDINLPSPVNPAKSHANFKDGLIELQLAKAS